MQTPLDQLLQPIVEAVLTAPGVLDAAVREAIFDRASGEVTRQSDTDTVPPPLWSLVDKIANRANTVTDADIDQLRREGFSEDAIFEAIISAAVGAGIARADRGLAALLEADDTR